MILRRFMQHVREQNWFAVGIDVMVVVGSVFLATQLSSALDTRRADQDLKASMRNLHKEFAREITWSESATTWQKLVMAGLRDAVAVLDGSEPEGIDLDRVYWALRVGMSPPPGLNFQATLQELRDSGELRRIPYENLSSVLIEILGGKESFLRFYEREMRGTNEQPLQYSFIKRDLNLDVDKGPWGAALIVSVDWEQARKDADFRFRLLQAHSVFASNTIEIERDRDQLVEAVSILKDLGFEPSNDLRGENREPLGAQEKAWTGELGSDATE
ncbi:MAG: hypothetical protein AAFY29_02040 [Pseudomonadota bacterium]